MTKRLRILALFAMLAAIAVLATCAQSPSSPAPAPSGSHHLAQNVITQLIPGPPGPAGVPVVTVSSPSALTATEAKGYLTQSGALAFVTAPLRAYFAFDAASTATITPTTVLGATINGSVTSGATPGRWIRTEFAHPDNLAALIAQGGAYVSQGTGSDANTGTQASPLKSVDEVSRRVGRNWGALVVTILDATYSADLTVSLTASGASPKLQGTQTTLRSGTLSAIVAADRVSAGGNPTRITDAGVSDWSTYAGKFVVITAGPNAGAWATIGRNIGGGVAETSYFVLPPTTNPSDVSRVVPSAPIAYKVVSITQLTGGVVFDIAAGYPSGAQLYQPTRLDVLDLAFPSPIDTNLPSNAGLIFTRCQFTGGVVGNNGVFNACSFGNGTFTILSFGGQAVTINAAAFLGVYGLSAGNVFMNSDPYLLASQVTTASSAARWDFEDYVGVVNSDQPFLPAAGGRIHIGHGCYGSGNTTSLATVGPGSVLELDATSTMNSTGTGGGYKDVLLATGGGSTRSTIYAVSASTGAPDGVSHTLSWANVVGATFGGHVIDLQTGARIVRP